MRPRRRDDSIRHRIARHRVLREFSGVRWAIEQEDELELAESIEKLRVVLKGYLTPKRAR